MRIYSNLIFIIIFVFLLSCSQETIKEVEKYESASAEETGLYPTLNGLYAKLNTFKQNRAEQVRLFEIGRSGKLNHPIPLVRIGYNSDLSQKRFLFIAGTHGDEAACVAALLYSLKRILNSTLPDTLNDLQISADFIPVHNPDGYAENQRENGSGLDLNRNFPFGSVRHQTVPEVEAVINLINKTEYTASLFFHSANEQKYENLVRTPVEYQRSGLSVLNANFSSRLTTLEKLVTAAGNAGNPDIPWHSSSDLVNVAGIASDWCVSGYLNDANTGFTGSPCQHSHPSLTVEICYPKQPMDENKLQTEQQETFNIIKRIILDY